MKNIHCLLLYSAMLAAAGCSGTGDKKGKPKQFPKPGTIVAADKMAVANDSLNHFTFSIKVVADSNVAQGTYDVDVDFGPNYAGGQFTLPAGGADFRPVIRKADLPNTFIVGFKIPGDSTFYDYYEVSSSRDQTKMRYIKAYSFN